MFAKSLVSALALSLAAGSALAMDTPSQGAAMLAQIAGVEPGAYATADVIRLDEASRSQQNSLVVRTLLDQGSDGITGRAASTTGSPADGGQLAAAAGVASGAYTIDELARIDEASRSAQSAHEVRFLLAGGAQDDSGASRGTGAARTQIAGGLGVDPADFTLAQLIRLDDAASDNDRFVVQAILDEAGVQSVTASEVLR